MPKKSEEPRLHVVGYRYASRWHLMGPNGPRGGKKTLCGRGLYDVFRSCCWSTASQMDEWINLNNTLMRHICRSCKEGMKCKS